MTNTSLRSRLIRQVLTRSRALSYPKNPPSDLLATKTPIFLMIFGKGERRRTGRTSNENLTKSAKIAAFWQGSFYSWLASSDGATLFGGRVFEISLYRFSFSEYLLYYDEEKTLVNHCIANADKDTASALLVLLYTGLRRSELKTLKIIDGTWLECETSKERMGKNIVKRQIPFTPMMKRVLPYIDFEKARNVNLNSLNTAIKRIFPNHHLHELRYTFITRCKESGVHGEVVLLWDGHEEDKTIHSSKVDRGYTDFSKEFQLKEATKVNYLEWNFEETEK